MSKASRPLDVLLAMVAVVGTACSDDGSGGGGQGGQGGSEQLTCTEDAPPDGSCDLDIALGAVCELEIEAGCPTTTVSWTCENGEGGPGWHRRSDSHCDCAGDGSTEPACSALVGCAWAVPDDVNCFDELFGEQISTQGCYRTGCGYGSWGSVDGECHSDLCEGPP